MAESGQKSPKGKTVGKGDGEPAVEPNTSPDAQNPPIEPASVPESVSEPVATTDEEPVFTHERLIQRAARTVGYPSHVIAGALAGTDKEQLTIEETRALCEAWVKNNGGEEK